MGNFYTNLTFRGPDQNSVAAAVAASGYHAYISPTVSGLTVVCEEGSDTQNIKLWHAVAKQLSTRLGCPALAVLNHDDDVLVYALYRSGALLDEYNSFPGYFGGGEEDDGDEEPVPSGGNAALLCEAFGMPGDRTKVEQILRAGLDGYTFALERHSDLAKALGWPELELHQGFRYVLTDGTSANWREIP